MSDRPTHAERAEAADRLYEQIVTMRSAGHRARQIVRERQNQPSSTTHPLFPFTGGQVERAIDTASEVLGKALDLVAAYAYEEHRLDRLAAPAPLESQQEGGKG